MARHYKQGAFIPKYPAKYVGNVANIFYRSSWELKFMNWCDTQTNVLLWQSEETIIPYLSPVDQRMHRYFCDFLIQVQNKAGEKKNFLVEIKPFAETIPPKGKKKTRQLLEAHSTFAVNQAKWAAARQWCRNKNIEFMVLTEKELGV